MMNLQFAAAFAIGLAGLGGGVGIGLASLMSTSAVARNPEMASVIRANTVLAMVFAESVAIYGLVVALMILFGVR